MSDEYREWLAIRRQFQITFYSKLKTPDRSGVLFSHVLIII